MRGCLGHQTEISGSAVVEQICPLDAHSVVFLRFSVSSHFHSCPRLCLTLYMNWRMKVQARRLRHKSQGTRLCLLIVLSFPKEMIHSLVLPQGSSREDYVAHIYPELWQSCWLELAVCEHAPLHNFQSIVK